MKYQTISINIFYCEERDLLRNHSNGDRYHVLKRCLYHYFVCLT